MFSVFIFEVFLLLVPDGVVKLHIFLVNVNSKTLLNFSGITIEIWDMMGDAKHVFPIYVICICFGLLIVWKGILGFGTKGLFFWLVF